MPARHQFSILKQIVDLPENLFEAEDSPQRAQRAQRLKLYSGFFEALNHTPILCVLCALCGKRKDTGKLGVLANCNRGSDILNKDQARNPQPSHKEVESA
jgi:hypothetical protein